MARRKSDPDYCIDCGWRWPALGGSRCPECSRKRMLMARRKREKQVDPSQMGIDEINALARERGISYGQMVVLLEQGKV